MALQLPMVGLVVQDMGKSLEFYRRLGLAIPEGSAEHSHFELKTEGGLTFFWDSVNALWPANTEGLRRESRQPDKATCEMNKVSLL